MRRVRVHGMSGSPFQLPPPHRPSRPHLHLSRPSQHQRPSPCHPHARLLHASVDARGVVSWKKMEMGRLRGGRRRAGAHVRVDAGHARARYWLVQVVVVDPLLLRCGSGGGSARGRADACAGATQRRAGACVCMAAAMEGDWVLRLGLGRSVLSLVKLGLRSAVKWVVVGDRRRSRVRV